MKNYVSKVKNFCFSRYNRKIIEIRKIILLRLFNLFNLIENNNNADPRTNGEFNLQRCLVHLWYNNNLKKITIFDVGAHIGDWSWNFLRELRLRNLNFELHLFEPQKSCFEILQKRFHQFPNVYLNPFGISDKEETQTIYMDSDSSSLASLYRRKTAGVNFHKEEVVHLERLDKYIKSKSIEKIHFIKIDTEGHDMKVLLSLGEFLSNDFIDFIQFEYGGANIDSRTFLFDFFNLLEWKGFSIAKILKRGLDLRKWEHFMENFQYSNYVAISNNILNTVMK